MVVLKVRANIDMSANIVKLRPRRQMMRHDYLPVSVERGEEDPSDLESDQCTPDKRVSLMRIYLLSVVNFGISAAWSLEMAVTTPYFASALKSGPVLSHVVWVLGPISGLVMAPLVGYMSDRCTSRYGRRRPFVIAGAVGTFAGMMLFPHAREIAARLFSAELKHRATLVVAVLSFALMDFSINTTMFPVRALQGDLVPEHQQHTVQSATLVMGSLGDLCVNAILRCFDDPVKSIRLLFVLTGFAYAIASTALLFIAQEERYQPAPMHQPAEEASSSAGCLNTTRGIVSGVAEYVRSIPDWLWRVGGVFALGFFSFFCMLPNFSSWLGSSVLQGDPTAKIGSPLLMRYQQGITAMGKAGVVRAAISVIVAATYPRLLEQIGAPLLIFIVFGTYGVIMCMFASTHNINNGQFTVAAYSVPMTILLTIPMAITVKKSSRTNRGKHLGTLNIFAVVPQLVDTAYTGYVSKMLGEEWVMRIGGMWSICTAFFAYFFLRD